MYTKRTQSHRMLLFFLIEQIQKISFSTAKSFVNFCVIPVILVRFLARARCRKFDDRKNGIRLKYAWIKVHHDKYLYTEVHWVVALIREQSSSNKTSLCASLDRLNICVRSLASPIYFNSRFAAQAGRHWRSPIMACHQKEIFIQRCSLSMFWQSTPT